MPHASSPSRQGAEVYFASRHSRLIMPLAACRASHVPHYAMPGHAIFDSFHDIKCKRYATILFFRCTFTRATRVDAGRKPRATPGMLTLFPYLWCRRSSPSPASVNFDIFPRGKHAICLKALCLSRPVY